MTDIDVRIVKAGQQRLAYARAFGASPEIEAIESLLGWARPKGLLEGPRGFHLFGANDPPPGGPGEEYGYFFGVTVPGDVGAGEGIHIKQLPSATYAVARFKGIESITAMWRALYDWVDGSDAYRIAGHGLEELLTPPDRPPEEWTFDLWLPVVVK